MVLGSDDAKDHVLRSKSTKIEDTPSPQPLKKSPFSKNEHDFDPKTLKLTLISLISLPRNKSQRPVTYPQPAIRKACGVKGLHEDNKMRLRSLRRTFH